VLSGCGNHAVRLPAAVAVTAFLPTHKPRVRNLLKPFEGRGSKPFIHLSSPNDGQLSDPLCMLRLITQLYLPSCIMAVGQGYCSKKTIVRELACFERTVNFTPFCNYITIT
jgi:hypothetical protein